jgi:hypothetical protein
MVITSFRKKILCCFFKEIFGFTQPLRLSVSTKQRQVIPAAGGRQQVIWRADGRQQVVWTDSRRNQGLFPSLYRLALHGEFKIGFQIDWLYYVKLRQQCMASFTSFLPYHSPPLPSPPKLCSGHRAG